MTAPRYTLVGISPARIVELERAKPGAPTTGSMVDWGRKRGCVFVGRYYPTHKGWRALKIDTAVMVTFGRKGQGWKGVSYVDRTFPSKDAMAMQLMLSLGVRC